MGCFDVHICLIILSSAFGRFIDRLSEVALTSDIPGGACGHLSSQALMRRQRPLGQGGDFDAKVDEGRTSIRAVMTGIAVFDN